MVARSKVDFADVARRAQKTLKTAQNEVVQDLAQTVVERTGEPFFKTQTGFARGSWFVDINDSTQTPGGDEDKKGAQTVARMSSDINDASVGDKIGILNGAKYVPRLEYGFVGKDDLGRYYNQRPRNFVRSTINDAPQIAEETIRRIAKT